MKAPQCKATVNRVARKNVSSPIFPSLLIVIFALIVSLPSVARVGDGLMQTVSAASYECEGNACSVVTVTWQEDGQAFRVDSNSSNQRVKVEVTTFAGQSSITVEPQKSDYLRVTYFNGPYHANYE